MLQLPLPNVNLATHLLAGMGKDINDYDGRCADVTDLTLGAYEGRYIYVHGDALNQYDWWYHAVPMVNGLVHDAWLEAWHQVPEPQALEDWLVKMFGTEDEIRVTIDGDDVYTGLPQNYKYAPVVEEETLTSHLISEGIAPDLREYCSSGV